MFWQFNIFQLEKKHYDFGNKLSTDNVLYLIYESTNFLCSVNTYIFSIIVVFISTNLTASDAL